MKLIRVPWIRCRADEFGTVLVEMCSEGRDFVVMAYSEAEAREWWDALSEGERREALGVCVAGGDDGLLLF